MTDTRCPTCGEPVEPRQLVCLHCGGRVALRRRWALADEPVTALAALLVVTIVVGAGLFGFAISELTSGDGAPAAETVSAPSEAAAEGPAVVAGEGQPERTSTETTPAAPAAPEPVAPAGSVPGWPDDLRAHTVVLVTSADRAAALEVANQARKTGLEAGLLRSDPYDLGTGLWIVFSGQFTTPEGAQRQAEQLAGRYPGAYPQLVQRSQ